MESEIEPVEVKLRNGVTFRVHATGPRLTIVTAPDDEHARAAGLSAYRTGPAADGYALHAGMPVEIVRAYCRVHGGVAQIGATAQRLLQALPSQADPPMGAPATDSHARAVEAAPEAPLPAARAASETGAAAAPVAARASHQPGAEPRLQLDELTEAVIEARRAVAESEGPLVWRAEWGRHRSDELPEVAALWRRITSGSGLARRLIIVTHARYASHPLLAEAVRLRERLQQIAADAMAERDARREADHAAWRARNSRVS